jgi:PTS system mannose-specific IID component
VSTNETRDTASVPAPPPGVRASIYLRTLALQASWNPQRMQNLGMLVALLPWLRRNVVDPDERRRFCKRHFEFFNTNPYVAPYVVGGVLRLETERLVAGEAGAVRIRTFRDSLARSFAAVGDQLVWLGMRPAVLLLAAVAVLLGLPAVAVGVVVVSALIQLELRRRALDVGFRRGFGLVEVLARGGWHRAVTASKNAGKLLTGVAAGCFFGRILAAPAGADSPGPVLAIALGAVLPLLARDRLSGEGYLLCAAVLVPVLSYGL